MLKYYKIASRAEEVMANCKVYFSIKCNESKIRLHMNESFINGNSCAKDTLQTKFLPADPELVMPF